MKILVVGLQIHDAGKTTLCKALIHGLKAFDVNLVPFKPHSGIGYWNQYDAFQDSLVRGVLLSSDIVELEEAANSRFPLELLNPVNRLSSPTLHREATEERLAFREFVAERFTHYDGSKCRSIYYLNGTINTNRMRGMKAFFLTVKRNAEKVIFIKNFQQLVKAYVENFDKATGSCYRSLQEKPLIMESFNDAAYPFTGVEDCSVVICTLSRTVLRFNGREYFKAIELLGQRKPKAQMTTTDVYSSSLVERMYELQPLTDDERRDPTRLTANYSEIVDDLAHGFKN